MTNPTDPNIMFDGPADRTNVTAEATRIAAVCPYCQKRVKVRVPYNIIYPDYIKSCPHVVGLFNYDNGGGTTHCFVFEGLKPLQE